ncbi:hypothetical protein TTHERM_000277122 (macronuclear) [Tetrahymena thermophila SB210]|uniref:Uncharacterized protein n=1 Tax=Tetrahymena thermophila (strain SB210) TaxID=312017 RepID=W7XJ42_TETTS|nr:hypothetical protein TTHERM_000277122 [Tetrahymena thermophila SB210]EWS73834.1 hypothetical protein TTHERM_000277122 [Tetrahymena thermophila SB210]|eukprot:XP_012653581.1 hypothetical protein TTHERM_000277122 [Tetrahymena thermophila SB210]
MQNKIFNYIFQILIKRILKVNTIQQQINLIFSYKSLKNNQLIIIKTIQIKQKKIIQYIFIYQEKSNFFGKILEQKENLIRRLTQKANNIFVQRLFQKAKLSIFLSLNKLNGNQKQCKRVELHRLKLVLRLLFDLRRWSNQRLQVCFL